MKKNKLVKLVSIFFISLFFFNCSYSGFIFGIPYGAKYDMKMSYIMGRFYMARCYGGTIYLKLKNIDTGETYQIGFIQSIEKNVLLRAVVPGRYRIDELFYREGNQYGKLVYYDLDGPTSYKISESLFNKYAQDFLIKKGSIYYLGDFSVYCKPVYPTNLIKRLSGFKYFVWELKSIVNNYDKTEKEFKNSYTNFKEIPIENVFK